MQVAHLYRPPVGDTSLQVPRSSQGSRRAPSQVPLTTDGLPGAITTSAKARSFEITTGLQSQNIRHLCKSASRQLPPALRQDTAGRAVDTGGGTADFRHGAEMPSVRHDVRQKTNPRVRGSASDTRREILPSDHARLDEGTGDDHDLRAYRAHPRLGIRADEVVDDLTWHGGTRPHFLRSPVRTGRGRGQGPFRGLGPCRPGCRR